MNFPFFTVNPFTTPEALRINARRLEHLASLNLPIKPRSSVLEVGAGQGMLSSYFIDRGHLVTLTDARMSNISVLMKKYPQHIREIYDVGLYEHPCKFDVVFCYGTLYHTSIPRLTLFNLAAATKELLLLETCVTHDGITSEAEVEEPDKIDQSITGIGSRPNRGYVWQQLKDNFSYVYMPYSQPAHPDFPWTWKKSDYIPGKLYHAVFVASRRPLNNPQLSPDYLYEHYDPASISNPT